MDEEPKCRDHDGRPCDDDEDIAMIAADMEVRRELREQGRESGSCAPVVLGALLIAGSLCWALAKQFIG